MNHTTALEIGFKQLFKLQRRCKNLRAVTEVSYLSRVV
jgi:hypothetical protein